MKKIKYIFVAAALGLTMSSCYDLDLEPKGLIYENVLMKSESGLQKYWAMVFQDLPIEDFNFAMNGEHNSAQSVRLVGTKRISGVRRKRVLHPQLWRLPDVPLPMVTVGDIGLTTASVTLIISWSNFRITRNTIMKKHTKIFMLRPFSCGLFTTLDW